MISHYICRQAKRRKKNTKLFDVKRKKNVAKSLHHFTEIDDCCRHSTVRMFIERTTSIILSISSSQPTLTRLTYSFSSSWNSISLHNVYFIYFLIESTMSKSVQLNGHWLRIFFAMELKCVRSCNRQSSNRLPQTIRALTKLLQSVAHKNIIIFSSFFTIFAASHRRHSNSRYL